MNNIINKFLLAGDKFMPEMHLRQPQFTYSVCGPFTKHKQRIQNAYSDSKDLTKRTFADKILRNKAFNIAKNQKYDGYQRGLASMVYKLFDKKSALLADKSTKGSGVATLTNKFVSQNHQLAEELHKPVIRKFKKRKAHSAFKDNNLGADLSDMQLLSRHNKGIRFLLCVIDNFSQYAWVVPLKDKKRCKHRCRISKYFKKVQ